VSDFHVTPQPETVATIVDGYGHPFARERWGWLSAAYLSELAAEGRRRKGLARPPCAISGPASHTYVGPAWDGPEISVPRLTPSVAAAALGVSVASLCRGG